ncbi:hypothetical protein SAMN05421819_1404 [Bryocella elongata]|uniref:Uncharacterized protein n=1 Tax=Bryocella elongata TaxID=863522 RepID=A0A1H5W1A6_9BACT|nr:hypothetical protein [Bryocella elongata]SEF93304.1 hypothetical protein SAMN05421819_1404 [Bryocella elongata]
MTYDPAFVPISSTPAPVSERRPTGVVIAALTLGLASLGLLVMAGFLAVAVVVVGKSPQMLAAAQSGTPQGAMPPSIAAIQLIYVAMSIVSLGLAVWGGVTVVGLFRLKPWARISIMVQGGLVAASAGFFALICLIAPLMMSSMKLPSNVSSSQMHIVFAVMGLIAGLVALVGVWWIVYFALRGAREVFSPSSRPGQSFGSRSAIATPALPPRQVGPITDFSVAQPLPPTAPPPPENIDPEI